MFRIGEFSSLSSISIYMLRNYDKIGLLSPDYTDPFSGYRYYSEKQILTANRIQALKAMGFGLKEIGEILEEEENYTQFQQKLTDKIEEKEQEIEKLQREIMQMRNALSGARKEEEYLYDIAVKTIPQKNIICLRDKIRNFPEEGKLWAALNKICQEGRVEVVPQGMVAAIQHEINYDDDYIDVEVLLEVEKKGTDIGPARYRTLESCQVAAIAFEGQYTKFERMNFAMAKWVNKNHYEICGNPMNIYHISPKNEEDESKFITEICFPVKKKDTVY